MTRRNHADVIFLDCDGEAVAVFPREPGTNDPATCLCYGHVGQHGSCYEAHAREWKRADPGRAEALARELRGVGYDLHVVEGFRRSDVGVRSRKIARDVR